MIQTFWSTKFAIYASQSFQLLNGRRILFFQLLVNKIFRRKCSLKCWNGLYFTINVKPSLFENYFNKVMAYFTRSHLLTTLDVIFSLQKQNNDSVFLTLPFLFRFKLFAGLLFRAWQHHKVPDNVLQKYYKSNHH